MATNATVYLIRNTADGRWYGERPAGWCTYYTNARWFGELQEAIRYSKTRQILKGCSEVVPVQLSFPDPSSSPSEPASERPASIPLPANENNAGGTRKRGRKAS